MNVNEEKVLVDMLLERFGIVIPEWSADSENVLFEHTFEGYELIRVDIIQPINPFQVAISSDFFVRRAINRTICLVVWLAKDRIGLHANAVLEDSNYFTFLSRFELK